jgi:hypothetical protein
MDLHKKDTFNVIVQRLVFSPHGASVTVNRVPRMSLAYLITTNNR